MNARNRTRASLAMAALASIAAALAVTSADAQQTSAPGSKSTYWALDTTVIPVANGCADALPQLEAVLRKSPQDHEAWRQLGRCHGEAKAPEKRLAAYQAAWKLRPGDAQDAYRVAWSLEDMKRWQEALDSYNAALALDPAHAQSILGKGVTLYHLKRYAEALPQLNEALRCLPDDSRVLLHRALVLDRLDRLDEAMADLYRVIRTKPDWASRAYFAMMGIFEWRRMAAEVLATTKIFLRYEPGNQSVLRDLPRRERNAQTQAALGRMPTHMPLSPEQIARASAPPAPSPFPASTRTQESTSLAVGPDAGGYSCPDGRQIWVSRCYDQSAQASCQVVHLHQKNNGLNPETAATRAEILVSLRDCTLKPLAFGPQGVSLVK